MTLVVSWIKRDSSISEPEVWALADGKVMAEDSTLTLQASKILELHIRCKYLKGPPPREVYYRGSVGFAYAGSTLTGFNTYATLSDIVANLGGDKEKNDLPAYKDIVEKAKRVLSSYITSSQSMCSIVLFGFCPKSKMPFISKLIPKATDNGIEFDEEETSSENTLQCFLLGDQIEAVKGSIINIAKDYKPDQYQYWNVPTAVFYDIIKRNLIKTVGGGIQLAIAYKNEFQMNAVATPRADDTTKDTLVHKSFDIFDDIGLKVGDCYFAMDSMDIGVSAYGDSHPQ